MANPQETSLLDRITELRKKFDLSERQLSIDVTGKPDLIRDIKRRGHLPTADNLARMAQVLGTTTDYLLGYSKDSEQVRSEVGLSERPIDLTTSRSEPGIPLVGTGDCADLEVCDESGKMVQIERSSFDEDYHVRMIARPPALRGARDLYAVYFHGESMQPRFEPGEVGIVDPRRPAGPGDYVLVQLNAGDSDEVVSVLVKRLVRQNARELVLEQFNPALTFTVPKSRIARVHRILQQTDLLFG
ncbi:S24 family peptidase [Qipengyuania huizhouensis]|uniref:S24 family peptidase n=1 Tax=Qipengyuania huizhouensis TaxID=2867245 RepID=UPI001C871358|nr:S24 family peptidase [Qipengyuania huizhouensis]MBX7459529.1 hypothetical protein [Qipengyuania huizhouensis]